MKTMNCEKEGFELLPATECERVVVDFLKPASKRNGTCCFTAGLICACLTAISLLIADTTFAQVLPPSPPCNVAISIMGSSVVIYPDPDRKNSFVTDILVRNDGTAPLLNESVTFYLFGFDGRSLDSPQAKQVGVSVLAGAIQDLRLSLDVKESDLPASGFVVVGTAAQNCTDSSKQQSQPFLIPSQSSPRNSCLIVLLTAGSALVVFVTVLLKFRSDLEKPMGSSEWSFSASAATNITVVGTLLTGVLVSTAVPDNPHYLTKQGYFVLSLLFGIVVSLAPIVYNFCCRPTEPDPANPQSLGFAGSVWLFLLSAAFTVWGIFGQLTTMSVMFQEFARRKTISQLSAWGEWVVAGSVAVSILFYCYRCIDYYVKKHPARLSGAEKAKLGTNMLASITSDGAPRWTTF
jgi:hypothetical protein